MKFERLYQTFVAELNPLHVVEWTTGIEAYEADPTLPDPYASVSTGTIGSISRPVDAYSFERARDERGRRSSAACARGGRGGSAYVARDNAGVYVGKSSQPRRTAVSRSLWLSVWSGTYWEIDASFEPSIQ